MKVFVDTGAFCAIAHKKDQWHQESSNILKSLVDNKAIFYTSNFVLSETYTLIRFRLDYRSAIKFMDEFELSSVKLLRVSQGIEDRAKEIFKQYKDKAFSFSFLILLISQIIHNTKSVCQGWAERSALALASTSAASVSLFVLRSRSA
ncbi:MAG: PIN domain-containing protein [bacterium]